jgi:hypothetical protein
VASTPGFTDLLQRHRLSSLKRISETFKSSAEAQAEAAFLQIGENNVDTFPAIRQKRGSNSTPPPSCAATGLSKTDPFLDLTFFQAACF